MLGDHGDGTSFNGPGKVYAHANKGISPKEIHFDDDERFSYKAQHSHYFVRPPTTVDFVMVVIHEAGHILGLGHTPNKDSVMYATILHQYAAGSDYKLHSTDISAVKSRFGKNHAIILIASLIITFFFHSS